MLDVKEDEQNNNSNNLSFSGIGSNRAALHEDFT